jgi:hypothetical protein
VVYHFQFYSVSIATQANLGAWVIYTPDVSWCLIGRIVACIVDGSENWEKIDFGHLNATAIQCPLHISIFGGDGVDHGHKISSCWECSFHLDLTDSEPSRGQNLTTAEDGSPNGHEIRHRIVTVTNKLPSE